MQWNIHRDYIVCVYIKMRCSIDNERTSMCALNRKRIQLKCRSILYSILDRCDTAFTCENTPFDLNRCTTINISYLYTGSTTFSIKFISNRKRRWTTIINETRVQNPRRNTHRRKMVKEQRPKSIKWYAFCVKKVQNNIVAYWTWVNWFIRLFALSFIFW